MDITYIDLKILPRPGFEPTTPEDDEYFCSSNTIYQTEKSESVQY